MERQAAAAKEKREHEEKLIVELEKKARQTREELAVLQKKRVEERLAGKEAQDLRVQLDLELEAKKAEVENTEARAKQANAEAKYEVAKSKEERLRRAQLEAESRGAQNDLDLLLKELDAATKATAEAGWGKNVAALDADVKANKSKKMKEQVANARHNPKAFDKGQMARRGRDDRKATLDQQQKKARSQEFKKQRRREVGTKKRTDDPLASGQSGEKLSEPGSGGSDDPPASGQSKEGSCEPGI